MRLYNLHTGPDLDDGRWKGGTSAASLFPVCRHDFLAQLTQADKLIAKRRGRDLIRETVVGEEATRL